MKTLEGTSSSPSSILRSQGTSSSKHRTIDVYGKMGESVSETPRLRKRSISLGMKDMVSSKNEARDVLKTQLASPWNEKSSIGQHCPSPIHCLQATEVDVNLISTDILSPNPRPLCALPPMNVPEGMVLPISCLVDAEGMFDSRRDVIYDNIGVATNRYAKSLNNLVTRDVDIPRVDSFISILDNTDSESATNFSMALCTVEQLQRRENFTIPMIGPTSMSNNGENEILAQSHALNKRVSEEDIIYGGNHHPLATIPPIVASARNANEKLRRDKIAEGIKSLQNSVPFSNKGNRDSVLDDAIDYIKFLKLQLKVLSQSRLCGEPTPYPFVHLEGYGHYLLHQQMCSEPLEEMMGELMNVSMQTANELLESKGLAILPMAFAYTILHTA